MQLPKNIKAVLFDLDETLIVHSKSFEEVAHATFADFAHALPEMTPEQFWNTFWPKAIDMWFMMFDGVIDSDVAQRYTYINALRAMQADESLAEAMLNGGETHLVDCTDLRKDALEVIMGLRRAGYSLGLITNGYSRTQRRKIDRYQLAELMDVTLVSGEVGSHKPDSGIFHEALARLNLQPEEAVYVGDMPENDIRGAIDAGMYAVLIDAQGKWANIRDEQEYVEPNATIRTLSELPRILGMQ